MGEEVDVRREEEGVGSGERVGVVIVVVGFVRGASGGEGGCGFGVEEAGAERCRRVDGWRRR